MCSLTPPDTAAGAARRPLSCSIGEQRRKGARMNAATSKDGLRERIERERALWDDLVAAIGEDRMLLLGTTADWSFKDVVAHLNGWRIVTLARLDAARNQSNPAPPPWPAHFDHNSEE